MKTTLSLLATQDKEAENLKNLLDQADQKLALEGNQDIIDLSAETNRLRDLKDELQKEKENVEIEAREM